MGNLIATVFGVGYMRPAPGTWGPAAGTLAALGLHYLGGFPLLAAATIIVFFVGWWATAEATRGKTDHDPSEIVIDEVAGVWLTLWVVSYGAWHAGIDPLRLYPGWIAGFVFFRVFDILKPGPVGWADRRGDALGVMLDDMIAGVFAAIAVGASAYIFHAVLS